VPLLAAAEQPADIAGEWQAAQFALSEAPIDAIVPEPRGIIRQCAQHGRSVRMVIRHEADRYARLYPGGPAITDESAGAIARGVAKLGLVKDLDFFAHFGRGRWMSEYED